MRDDICDFRRLLALQCPLILKPGKINSLLMFALVSFILVQKPAPVSYINVTPSDTSAQVTLGNPTPETSSYIKYYEIYLNYQYKMRVNRQIYQTTFSIPGLKPNTRYTAQIRAGDGYSWSNQKSKGFVTSEAGNLKRKMDGYLFWLCIS